MDDQDPSARPKTLLKQLLQFNIIGLVNTAVTYVLYAGLVALGVTALVALLADYALGIVLSFLLNRHYTFEAREKRGWAMFGKMVLSYLPLLGLNAVLLALLVHVWAWNPYFAQLIAVALVAVLSFLVQKFFVFVPHKGSNV